MSRFSAFLAGLSLRSSKPTFDAGQEFSAFVTGHNGTTPLVRIGDSVLRVGNADTDDLPVDVRARFRVTAFDDDRHEGELELLGIEAASSF
ncbi:DUF7513 family protein [Natronomonas sp. EA1]|uniref:DUF7513 family protein n=1 Tax=Natronomonas sp. EA1 TaxID=3421655 RepID=UPI003EC0AFBD